MNFAESASLENDLKELGWSSTDDPANAQAIIINTCSVRQSAEERVWGRLGFLKNYTENRSVSLVLTGCLADHYGDEIQKRFPYVDKVVGNQQKGDLATLLTEMTKHRGEIDLEASTIFHFSKDHSTPGEFKAFVPIMHGCNNFCTYCIVPYVRGREISRDPNEILEEINELNKKGVCEITLLGQNVNSYNWNNRSFGWLLKEICERTNVRWLRFVSSHPKDLSHDIIKQMATYPQICNSLHLPVQHGSNAILSSMNRHYTREDYLKLVDEIRTQIPDISLTTDLLIGFPGETEEDLQDTFQLIEAVGFDDAFTYFYNPRVGTKAEKMSHQLSDSVKKERLQRVIDFQRNISLRVKEKELGKEVVVLAESISKKNHHEILGRTEKNNMVVFSASSDIVGTFVKVKLKSLSGTTFKGVLI